MVEKPSDCTCKYPEDLARNTTGHADDCPAHKRLIARQEVKVEGKPTPLPMASQTGLEMLQKAADVLQTPPDGFHSHDGWFFKRQPNGSVKMSHWHPAHPAQVDDVVLFAPDEWASIVASVCRYGETAQSFQMARTFHMAG